jgi:3-hydroxyacyl-CoA dehydrogenase
MAKPIRHVGVIGAGVMGSGIAAHLANAGVRVTMLDIVPPTLTEAEKKDKGARNRFAAGGLEKALKNKPALFFHKSAAGLVSVGNLEDDFDRLKDCDLIVEAVAERLDIKQSLFERLEKTVKADTVIASNTSGLRIVDMVKGRSDQFKKNFLVLHFFNPVRYMKLLEIVVGPETDPATEARMQAFGEDVLGKGTVFGKDTPNFVGNRIGIHAMMTTVHEMLNDKLSPEDVDNITGSPMGHPKSASYRTADLVGLDTFVHVSENCFKNLPNDEDHAVFETPAFIKTMVEQKLLGNKTKAGFYKKEGKDVLTFDPYTCAYRAKTADEGIKGATKSIAKIEDPKARVKALMADTGKAGMFAWKVVSKSLAYSARRIGEITDNVEAIDDAMKWGYNWELGPFETWDALGFVETIERMQKDGIKLPESVLKMKASGAQSFYKGDQVFSLVKGEYVNRRIDARNATFEILRKGAPVLKNDGAEAWDLGDGVLGLTFKTKANSIDADIISMLGQAAERAEHDFRGLVISNSGEHFCVGANLFAVVLAAGQQQWEGIRQSVKGYQAATQRLKYAKVPVVVCPYGMTLGGGLELCFAGDAVQAAAETYSGLVEVAVGLIPGGAGTLNMLWRALENIPDGVPAPLITQEYVTQVFKNIALAKIATSAEEAKQFGYFYKSDGISFDRSRQLTEAKARVLGLANAGYHPKSPRAFVLPGESGIATLSMMVDTLVAGGYASEHDAKIARKLAGVLCGGAGGASKEVTEDEILDLEAEAFVSLCGEAKSQERMQYMLMNNKPLRN